MLLPRLLLPEASPLHSVPALHLVAQLLLPETGALHLVHSHVVVSRQLLQETVPSPLLASPRGTLSLPAWLPLTMNQDMAPPSPLGAAANRLPFPYAVPPPTADGQLIVASSRTARSSRIRPRYPEPSHVTRLVR